MSLLPFRKILFPADFSEPSREALKGAVEIAAHFSAMLYILHVSAPVPVVSPGMDQTMESVNNFDVAVYQGDLVEHSKKLLQAMVDQDVPTSLEVKTMVKVGDPARVITETVVSEEIDLIVMATHGLTGISRFFLGSVAEKVVRHASVPVLTIRLSAEKD